MKNLFLISCVLILGCSTEMAENSYGTSLGSSEEKLISFFNTLNSPSELDPTNLSNLRLAGSTGYPEALLALALYTERESEMLGSGNDFERKKGQSLDFLHAGSAALRSQFLVVGGSFVEENSPESMARFESYITLRMAFFLREFGGDLALPLWRRFTENPDATFEELVETGVHPSIFLYGMMTAEYGRDIWVRHECQRDLRPEESTCKDFWAVPGWSPEWVLFHARHLDQLVAFAAGSGNRNMVYLHAAARLYNLPFVTDASRLTHAISGYFDEDFWVGDNTSGWRVRDSRFGRGEPFDERVVATIELLRQQADAGDWYAALAVVAALGQSALHRAHVAKLICNAPRASENFVEAVKSRNPWALPLFPRSGPFFEEWEAVWNECRL